MPIGIIIGVRLRMVFLLGFLYSFTFFYLWLFSNDYGNNCTHKRKSFMSALLVVQSRVSEFILCPLLMMTPESGSAHVPTLLLVLLTEPRWARR